VQTDRNLPDNKPDKVAIPADRNVIKTEAERVLKY
jgi:hypothetical protein